MSEDQRARVEAALAHPKVTQTRIATVVTGWGFPVSDSTVRTHQLGECACAR